MDAQEIHAGSDVYKALLRAYSMVGDTEGTERIFDAIQLAGICPDDKMCGLVINAYAMAEQSQKARITFENMRRAGIESSDKCVALVLVAYEKENKLNEAIRVSDRFGERWHCSSERSLRDTSSVVRKTRGGGRGGTCFERFCWKRS